MLTVMRDTKATWGRYVLCAFAIAWLAIALQPCAMAFGIEGPECPHCPPTEAPPCEVQASHDCGLDAALAKEIPSNPCKLKDVLNDVPVAILPATVDPARACHRPEPAPHDHLLLNPSGPPRNVLFCVYLN